MEQHSRQRYEDYKSFMRRHQKTVWRVCYDFAHGDIPRCEDMVQEAWIMLWLKFDTMTGRSEWQQRVWVRRVTRSVLVDLGREVYFDSTIYLPAISVYFLILLSKLSILSVDRTICFAIK